MLMAKMLIVGAVVVGRGVVAVRLLIDKKFLDFMHSLDKPMIFLQRWHPVESGNRYSQYWL